MEDAVLVITLTPAHRVMTRFVLAIASMVLVQVSPVRAQEPLDSAARADSIAVARALAELRADSLDAQRRSRQRADSVLRTPVVFARESIALTSGMADLIKEKAWLLYYNPQLRLVLRSVSDTTPGSGGIRLARARSDSIRRVFAARAIDVGRIEVQESVGSASEADSVTFVHRNFFETSVVDMPPASADPPRPERLVGLRPWEAGRRYQWGTVRVFYATDRARTGSANAEDFYDGKPNQQPRLEFGRLEVTVPRMHRDGVVERPVWYKLERTLDPNKHLTLKRVDPIDQPAVMDSLRRVVAASGSKEALVFIHGYNVSFRDAALRTAQLTYDMGFDGAPILYSWPSRGSLFLYRADDEAAEDSALLLEAFLDSVVAVTGARKVNVVAHSMGNHVLTLALEKLADAGRDTILNTVVMAAADVPASRFEQRFAPRIRRLMRHLTVYMSSQDKALWASRFLSTNTRLGEATSPALVLPNMETVDASAIRLDLLGHGYIGSSSYIIDDLVDLIHRKLPPPRRWLKPTTNPAGAAYWSIP